LANGSGCQVISVEYCLAPEHAFPEPVREALAVTRWVCQQASRLGVDSQRLAVGGDSAGGAIAAVVCQLAKAGDNPPLCHQLLIYPMTDLYADTPSRKLFARGYFLEERIIKTFGDVYLGAVGDARDTLVSPLRATDFSGLPSALVVTAGFDPLRDEALMYVENLEQAGVRVEHAHYGRMCHGFLNATGVLDAAYSALREIAETLHAKMSAR
jgi:acetyl esterase